jgi:hypothetical protein
MNSQQEPAGPQAVSRADLTDAVRCRAAVRSGGSLAIPAPGEGSTSSPQALDAAQTAPPFTRYSPRGVEPPIADRR